MMYKPLSLFLVLCLSPSPTEAQCTNGISARRPGRCFNECFSKPDCNSCPDGYNDGCNECYCDEKGNERCTDRNCLVQGQPYCIPGCSEIACTAIATCPDGQPPIIPAGECCPVCIEVQDCSTNAICPEDPPSSGECFWEGDCPYGSEHCCGKTHDSFIAQCFNNQVAAFSTDVCFVPYCPPDDEEECIPFLYDCDSCNKGYNDGCRDCYCDKHGNARCEPKYCFVQGQPFCLPDCSKILCAQVVCEKGESEITPPGECCPVCIPDPVCTAVVCPTLQCKDDEMLIFKPGQCCPECFLVGEDCSHEGGAEGDPHFQTWNGEFYDFHQACDLVLLKTEDFGRGLGLQVNIRTTTRYQYSFIESVAIRLGQDILEVSSWGEYFFNGVEEASTMVMAGIYTVQHEVISSKRQHCFEILLGPGEEKLVVTTHKDIVSVKVEHATKAHFGNSVGLMGSFPRGTKLGRDGLTVFLDEDTNAFGQEWQVLAGEDNLFQMARFPQHPQACVAPDAEEEEKKQSSHRRGLGETVKSSSFK